MKLSSGMISLLSIICGLALYKYYGNPNYAWAGITLGLTMWGFSSYITELKYKSPQFVSETVHGSYDKVYTFGEYTVIPLGAVKGDGFYLEGGKGWGGEGYVVVPTDAVWSLGTYLVAFTDPMPTPLEELPEDVLDILVRYFGIDENTVVYYTEKVLSPLDYEDPAKVAVAKLNQARLEGKLRNFNRVINELKALLAKKNDIVLDYVDLLGYIDRRLKRTTQGKIIEEWLKNPPKEEE